MAARCSSHHQEPLVRLGSSQIGTVPAFPAPPDAHRRSPPSAKFLRRRAFFLCFCIEQEEDAPASASSRSSVDRAPSPRSIQPAQPACFSQGPR